MEVSLFQKDMKPIAGNSVVAIGVFDGVHLAHRQLLRQAKEEADKRRLPLYVFTFLSESKTGKPSLPLYATEEKATLLEKCGVNGVLCADFLDVCAFSAEKFVKEILLRIMGCQLAVCGYNFRFGALASGDADTLSSLMTAGGKSELTIPPFLWKGDALSTTRIREMLSAGETAAAAEALGVPYHLSGKAERGLQIGQKIGIPTVNLSMPEGFFVPKSGVYAAWCEIKDKRYPAIVNVGVCPTFGARSIHAEAHLLCHTDVCYGDFVKLYLLSYLREERKFDSTRDLTAQIEQDKENARRFL